MTGRMREVRLKTVERSQQRSRELQKLEQLGRAIMNAPPDGSTLPQLLQAHLPAMFPSSRIEIRHFPQQTLARVGRAIRRPLRGR